MRETKQNKTNAKDLRLQISVVVEAVVVVVVVVRKSNDEFWLVFFC